MKIAIIGLGAVGGLLAYMARRVKPTVIYRSPIYREAIECFGGVYIRLSDGREEIVKVDHGYANEFEDSSFDTVFITVKAYDTRAAAIEASRLVKDGGVVVVVQNGIGGLEEAMHVIGEGGKKVDVALGVLTYGVTRLRAGAIEVKGVGELLLGFKEGRGDLELLRRVAELLDGNVRVVENIEPYRWLKVIVNAAINPLTVIANAPNRIVLELDNFWELAVKIVEEGVKVAEALGVMLPRDPLEAVREVVERTRNNISSMLQDYRAGRRTEIDYINGAIVRLGKEKNIDTPVNYTLTLLVKGFTELRRL